MEIIERVLGPDGVSTKYLQETNDGFVVEATYIKLPMKHTLCISTQVGCPLRCTFCASGLRSDETRFQRSLSSTEMVEECCKITQEMDFVAHPKPLTFAFMGEGEPFLNFDGCVKAFHMLTAMTWPVPIKLSISTSGIKPQLIRRLSEIEFTVPLKLQVSLHGSNDDVRSRIVPVSRPISEIVAATRAYRERCSRPVVWNYVMCDGINDQPEHAEQLAQLIGPDWLVKFTRLNPTIGSPFLPASLERMEQFRSILESNGLSTTYSETDESGIRAGCGQLSYHYTKEMEST